MPEQHDVRVLSVEQALVDEACIASVTTSVRQALHGQPEATARSTVAIDLTRTQDITPRALAALLEFPASQPTLATREEGEKMLALVGLGRRSTLLAVQVGLAEHFDFYASRSALENRGHEFPRKGMCAVIHELPDCIGVGALDVAGRALLVRQLQFLRDIGIEDVIVEIVEGPHAIERAQLVLGDDPLTARTQVIPSARPMGPRELARRAGCVENELFLSLPADLAVHGKPDLQLQGPTRYHLPAPSEARAPQSALELRSRREGVSAPASVDASGWAFQVQNLDQAHSLACAALEGRAPGLLVHAAEIKPGVWVARGARVSPEAQVSGPVLIGANARVLGDAKIGPRAVLGEGVVVERGAAVSEASVGANTILGEGTRIRSAYADAQGIVSFETGGRTPIGESLVLAARTDTGTALVSRLFALFLLVLLATPWLLGLAVQKALRRPAIRSIKTRRGRLHTGDSGFGVVDLLPALFDVVMGRRDLVGINDWRALEAAAHAAAHEGGDGWRAGAIDLSRAMAPGASTQTLLRMWRWYRVHKNASLDRSLWREGVFKPLRKPE
ncbi:MAG: hypothetical protein QM778_05455 [Myxococcales bacterium]